MIKMKRMRHVMFANAQAAYLQIDVMRFVCFDEMFSAICL